MKKIIPGILALIALSYLYISFSPLFYEPGLTNPEPVGPFLNGNFPDKSASDEKYQVAFPNLSFDSPLTFSTVPNSNHLVVAQQNGVIYRFENNDNVTQKAIIADLSSKVGVVWDGGFLGLAIHPEFGQPNKNYFYIYYTTKDGQGRDYPDSFVSGFGCEREDYWGGFLVLERISIDPNTLTKIPNEDLVMIKRRMFSSTHRGGGLTFGNDGFLYVATGDQSAYAKPQDVTTNLDGGVLRLDVNQDINKSHAPIRTLTDDGRFADEISGIGYGIPNNNPFLSPDGSRFEEYYSIGHRNPHRMTLDKLTGSIYIGEVGETRHEEINRLVSGKNYGWPVYEGDYYRGITCVNLLDDMPHERPLLTFPRTEANAIIGGYVYRGSAMSEYYGKYICADYGTGEEIWAVDPTTGSYEVITQFSPTNVISFGQDQGGELYLLSQGNNVKIYRLTQGGNLQGNMPQLLSETGAFSDVENLVPNNGLVPYDLIEPFWSDGAEKKRWMVIPNDGTHNQVDEQIQFSENGDWQFPTGTVLIKHFELPIDENNPSLTKRLETRFSIRASDGSFYFATYKWNAQETDAVLLTSGLDENIQIKNADGTSTYQKWTYPSNQDCVACHNPATGGTLGPRTRYLNSQYTYDKTGVTSNQLVTLSHLGILNELIDDNKAQNYLTYKALDDDNANLDEKARSYLDLNCAYCHRPGATGDRAQFDLRLFNSLQETGLLNSGINTPLGIPDEKILFPGDASKSILYHRINSDDPSIMMPPIAKNKIHQEAVTLIENWINQMDVSSSPPNYGDYRIVSFSNGETLQVSDGGLNNQANIATGSYNELDNQHFALEDAGNGFYMFKALHSDKYIDVAMGATLPGTNVWQYTGNGTDAQLWQLIPAGSDSFYIVSKLSGYYLGADADGNVAVMENTNDNDVKWVFTAMGISSGGDCNGQLSDVTEPVGSGTITSRNDFVPAEDRYKAFDNRSVRGDHSKWLDAGGIPTTASPSWIQIVLPEPRRVEQITITSANDDYGRDPMDFRLMASNGGTFELVGSWSGETFGQRYLKRTFDLSAPATYTTYRLEITKNDLDVEMTQIAEIELLGCDATPTGPMAVTGVELSPTSLQMEPGATLQLLANLSPSNATDKGVSWSSQDGAIATVDGNGNVTAIAPGSTTVTVTTDDGGFTASATVQVQDPGTGGDCNGQLSDVTEPVGSGTITSRNDFIPAEDRYKAFDNRSARGDHSKWLDAGGIPTTASPSWIQIVLPEPRRVEQITITSANDDYGRDPMDFRLMASNGGTFELVGSWSGETFDQRYLKRTFDLSAPATYTTYRLEITKNDLDVEMTQIAEIELLGCDATPTGPMAVTGVELSPTSLQMEPGATLQLLANLSPSNATDKGVSWSSQDGAIATVDGNGNVTAIAPGSTTVTVTTDDGGFTASATVQVQDPGTGGDCNGQLSDVTEPVGSGTITSRNDFIPAEDRYKAFDNKSTVGDHSKWLDAGGIPSTESPSWIQITLPQPRRVERITITSANDDYGRDPMDFRLMASNGGTFEPVGSWSGETFGQRYLKRTFELSAPATYTTYRLEITKNDLDVEMTQIAEIELLGCESISTSIGLKSKIEVQTKVEDNDELIVVPNPVRRDRHLELLLPTILHETVVTLKIFDVSGRMVHITRLNGSYKSAKHSLQLEENLSSGIYLLTIQGHNQIFQKKIVLE